MGLKGKMTQSVFTGRIGVDNSVFSRALQGKRNLGYDNAAKVARALKTKINIWRYPEYLGERVAAWASYCEKFNGGTK